MCIYMYKYTKYLWKHIQETDKSCCHEGGVVGDEAGVRGDLLFTISTLVTFQGCAM